MVLSLVFVRSYNFGWSPVYDCKAYLETNTVHNCSYFGFSGYFLVAGTRPFIVLLATEQPAAIFILLVPSTRILLPTYLPTYLHVKLGPEQRFITRQY